jgi:response regulator RpfG family c-di-GMP phosphodiesterase
VVRPFGAALQCSVTATLPIPGYTAAVPHRAEGRPAGAQVADRLLRDGRIQDWQLERALDHAQRMRMRVEDALVETAAITEDELLRYLASVYQTQFVGTAKLARVGIDPALLARVPLRAAEKLQVCPVLVGAGGAVLSVVCADPSIGDVAKELQLVSGAREVRVLVAMPEAVDALIRKHYRGEHAAFAAIVRPPVAPPSPARAAPAAPTAPPKPAAPAAPTPAAAAPAAPAAPQGAFAWGDYLESLNVLVAMLEQERGELRGHSGAVARLCRSLVQRLDPDEGRGRAIVAAAYLHDVGMASAYHLTGLNVAQYEGHRVQAERSHTMPMRLFDLVQLPEDTVLALTHHYERADGGGFPSGLRGKDIPLGARILSVADSYADLTRNSRNPFRRCLSPAEACDALDAHRDSIFDGAVLDALRREVLGDELRAKLLADRRRILLVDPDPEETTVLEMRLLEHGHEVLIVRTVADALARCAESEVDLVISEVDVPPGDGFALVQSLRERSQVPVLFLTRRGDRQSVQRGFELGAADYLVKPASAEVVLAKTRQALEGTGARRAARGVTGSLSEMGLPDVVQILASGRKSGRLTVRSAGLTGEVFFGGGQVHHATFGPHEGDEAFYRMLALTEGEFELDPSVSPERRTIHHPAEALLLEGMRRMDEGLLGP